MDFSMVKGLSDVLCTAPLTSNTLEIVSEKESEIEDPVGEKA